MEAVDVREYSLSLAGMRRVIFAPERWSEKKGDARPYLAAAADPKMILAVARPLSLEELQGLISQAARGGLALYTPMPFGLEPRRPGLVVDLSLMDRVWSLDSKRLTAVIEPGVTWEKLLPEVEALNLSMALPAAARHHYVLPVYQEKEIVLMASRYTNKQVSNLHMVLADGRIYKSGSHANLPNGRGARGQLARGRRTQHLAHDVRLAQHVRAPVYKVFVYLYPHFEERQGNRPRLSTRRRRP